MRELMTSMEIEAPISDVWEILVAFDEFPEWNPFMPSVAGTLEKGNRLTVRLEPPGGKGMTFHPAVTHVSPGRGFRWLGHLLFPGLFDGEHSFELEPLGDRRTRLVQREEFTGVLAPLMLRMVSASTRRGFLAMNEALKERAETRSTPEA